MQINDKHFILLYFMKRSYLIENLLSNKIMIQNMSQNYVQII